jgi:hypothetical protein
MLCDLIFLAVVVRLILEAARGNLGARATDVTSDSRS